MSTPAQLQERLDRLYSALESLTIDARASTRVLSDIAGGSPRARQLAAWRLDDMKRSPNGNALVAARNALQTERGHRQAHDPSLGHPVAPAISEALALGLLQTAFPKKGDELR